MSTDPSPDLSRLLSEHRSLARTWLFEHTLPLWWEHGADHRDGGFHEMLDARGRPVGSPARLRTQARQIYVFAHAGALGWTGPWLHAMRHGLDFMLTRYRRPDGLFRSTLDSTDNRVDLYDQAFVLFALAHAWRARPDEAEWRSCAEHLMARLDAGFRENVDGIFAYRAWLDDPAQRQ